jgi:hypothetical protein
MRFGTEEEQQAWLDAVQAAKREQRVQYAISPRQRFVTHDGRTLQAGDEFIPERDLKERPGTRYDKDRGGGLVRFTLTPAMQLADLLRRLVVIHPSSLLPRRVEGYMPDRGNPTGAG